MRWDIKLLKLINRDREKQRMEMRQGLARVEAQAEDLLRTIRFTPQQMQQLQAKHK